MPPPIVALVTGAGQGIGRAVALRLAADGAAVAVNDRSPEGAEATAEALRATGATAGAYPGDVSSSGEVESVVRRVSSELGLPAVLVNNAAVMTMAPLAELELGEWRRILATNLDGPFYCTRAVVPGMRTLGWGRIVNIASEWGVTGARDASHYAASKGGLIAFTKATARELGPDGITVNALAPGPVDTPQLAVDAGHAGVSLDEIRERYAAASPLRRIGRSEDIAGAVSYLVSALAGCVTGQVLCPAGGTTA